MPAGAKGSPPPHPSWQVRKFRRRQIMMYNSSAKMSHEESSGGLSHRDSAGDLGLEETSSRYEDDDEAVSTRRLSTWPARPAHTPLTIPRRSLC